jgi:sugar phosphate isomerase/epimerase
MSVSVTDWSDPEGTLPLAARFKAGVEVSSFWNNENLDSPGPAIEAYRAVNAPLESMHGPFMDLVPASLDRLVRETAHARFTTAAKIAKALGIGHIVFHSGYFPKTYPADIWLRNSTAFWKGFLAALPPGISIHIENVYEDDWQTLAALVDSLESPHAGLCLDIGHVNCNSGKSLKSWIEGLGTRIRHVHLHNNKGTLDDHFRLDFGTIAMTETLEALLLHAPGATWVVEARKEEREASLEWLDREGFLGRQSQTT